MQKKGLDIVAMKLARTNQKPFSYPMIPAVIITPAANRLRFQHRILFTTALATVLASLVPLPSRADNSCSDAAGCTITGNITGTYSVSGSIRTLTNNGSISSDNTGIYNPGAIGTLSNNGVISSGSTGIYNPGSIGSLSNSGSINGGSTGIYNSGTIGTLSNSGNISGGNYGIYNDNATIETLINAGSVIGAGEIVSIASGAVVTGPTLSVYNNASIMKSIDAGLYSDSDVVSIVNAGTISEINNVTIAGNSARSSLEVGVYNAGSIEALANSGSISGVNDGIDNYGTIGSLNNSGSISGSSAGIYNGNTIGTLSNSGSISGEYSAISNASAIGLLSNSGVISSGTYGIENDGIISSLSNSGSISGGHAGIDNADESIGLLINVGAIFGGRTGLINDSSIGTLSNSGTIAGGTNGLINRGTIGMLSNSGSISGGSTGIYNGNSIGTLGNSGNISGASLGIYNSGTIGMLSNSGSISGDGYGVFNNSTLATLGNSGNISGGIVGVINDGTIGLLSNNSNITGGTFGIINGGTIGMLSNSGSIAGSYYGVYNSRDLEILSNSGSISGGSFGIYNGKSIGLLSNSGTISNEKQVALHTQNDSIEASETDEAISTENQIAIYNYNGSIEVLNNSGVISGAAVGINNGGTYAGGTTAIGTLSAIGALINSGLIEGSSAAITNYGTLGIVANSGTIAGDIDNESSSPLVFEGGTGPTYGTLTGYDGSAGTISSAIVGAGITFASGNLLLNDDLVANGNSITNTGATLLVNGDISADSAFYVNGGELEIGDASNAGATFTDAAGVNVGASSLLRGHGTIIGDVTNSGTVYPGGSLGTLTIDGNYVQNSDGTLEIDVDDAAADQLAVTGSASLDGALQLNIESSYSVGTVDTIVTSNGLTGTFASVNMNKALESYVTPTVNYVGNDVELQLVPTTTNPTSPTTPTDPAAPVTPTTPSTPDYSNALAFRTGRIYVASSYAQNAALNDVLSAPLGITNGSIETDRGYWLHGIGSFGHANGYDFNAKGFVIGKGFDVTPNLVMGAAASNVYTSTTGGGSSVDGTSFGALAYGIYSANKLTLSGDIGVGHLSNAINRYLPKLGWRGKSASNGEYEGAQARLDYQLYTSSRFFLAPYAQASYSHTNLGSARESNAGILNLRYNAMSTSIGQLGAGLTGGYKLPVKYGTVTAWASLGGFGTLGNPRTANTEELGTFSARETALISPSGAFTPGVGISLAGKGPWRLITSWNGQFGSATAAQNVSLQASYKW